MSTLYPVVNLLLYVDLYWIMKNPFYPQRKRYAAYTAVMLTIIFLTICEEISIIFTPMDGDYYLYYSYPLFSLIINVGSFVWSLILIILIILRLLRKGTSPKLRRIIFVRYLTLYIVFLGQYMKLITTSIA